MCKSYLNLVDQRGWKFKITSSFYDPVYLLRVVYEQNKDYELSWISPWNQFIVFVCSDLFILLIGKLTIKISSVLFSAEEIDTYTNGEARIRAGDFH